MLQLNNALPIRHTTALFQKNKRHKQNLPERAAGFSTSRAQEIQKRSDPRS